MTKQIICVPSVTLQLMQEVDRLMIEEYGLLIRTMANAGTTWRRWWRPAPGDIRQGDPGARGHWERWRRRAGGRTPPQHQWEADRGA